MKASARLTYLSRSASVIALGLICQLEGFFREPLACIVNEGFPLAPRRQIIATHNGGQLSQARQIQTQYGVGEVVVLLDGDVLPLMLGDLVRDQLGFQPVVLGGGFTSGGLVLVPLLAKKSHIGRHAGAKWQLATNALE